MHKTLLLSLFLFFPGSASAAEVNVYSARHYDSDRELYALFTEQTGIKVNLVEGKGDALLARLKLEGEDSPADVLITVDAARLTAAEREGLFQPIDSATLFERIPVALRHPDGLWFGLTLRARCIFYRKDKVDPATITSYEDLADPKWKGKVLIRSSSNVYNQSLVGSLLVVHGKSATRVWLEGLVANLARKPQGGDTDQIRAVAAGEGDLAVANSYYYARLAKSEKEADQAVVEKVGILFPNQDDRGAHVNCSGAGVLKGARNKAEAIKLLEFLASDDAQASFAAGNNEFPVVESVEPEGILREWAFEMDTQALATFGRKSVEAVKLMDEAGWR